MPAPRRLPLPQGASWAAAGDAAWLGMPPEQGGPAGAAQQLPRAALKTRCCAQPWRHAQPWGHPARGGAKGPAPLLPWGLHQRAARRRPTAGARAASSTQAPRASGKPAQVAARALCHSGERLGARFEGQAAWHPARTMQPVPLAPCIPNAGQRAAPPARLQLVEQRGALESVPGGCGLQKISFQVSHHTMAPCRSGFKGPPEGGAGGGGDVSRGVVAWRGGERRARSGAKGGHCTRHLARLWSWSRPSSRA